MPYPRCLLPLLIACCLLTACASGPPPMQAPVVVQALQVPKLPPPVNLLIPPAALPAPASGRMTDLDANHRQVAHAYHLLAAQVCALLMWLEEPTGMPCEPYLNPTRKP